MGKIESTRFGTIEFDETSVISMPKGIIGFSEHHKFVLLQPDEDALFFWLHSVEDPELAFVVVDPRNFIPEYEVVLTPDERDFLDLSKEDDLGLLVLVTVPESSPKDITANLLAPLILHYPSSRAWQIVLDDSDYDIRHPLLGSEGEDA